MGCICTVAITILLRSFLFLRRMHFSQHQSKDSLSEPSPLLVSTELVCSTLCNWVKFSTAFVAGAIRERCGRRRLADLLPQGAIDMK